MVLEIVNVVDTVCTQILVEELEKHRKKVTIEEDDLMP
jgi:hypothetical protein